MTNADLVITGGSLIDMVGDGPDPVALKGLVIRDGTIDRIIPAGSGEELPPADRVIDAGSAFILPGYINAHVHFRPWTPAATIWRRGNLHYGVTTQQDFSPCGGNCPVANPTEWIMAYRDLLNQSPESGGPMLSVTGIKLDSPDGEPQDHGYRLRSLDEMDPYIDYLQGLGVDALYVEQGIALDYRRRAVQEAAERGLPLLGGSEHARESIEAGMNFIEHMFPITRALVDEPGAEPFSSPASDHMLDMSRAPEFIQYMVDNGVYLNPTMTSRYGALSDRAADFTREDRSLFEFGEPFSDMPESAQEDILAAYRTPRAIDTVGQENLREGFRKIQAYLEQFSEAGGMVLVGTDSNDRKMPGLTVHRELQMLVDAGITPYRALLGATRFPAQLFMKTDIIGTVEEGKHANLQVLASNPVDDIANSRDIDYVIYQGEVKRAPDLCSVIIPPITQTCWDNGYNR